MSKHFQMRVTVDACAQRAMLCIPQGLAASQVTRAHLDALVLGAGVQLNSGVDRSLDDIVATYRVSPQDQELEVATATPAVHGRDGGIAWNEGFDPNPTHAASTDRVDHHAGHRYVPVKVGDDVGVVVAPTCGDDGVDVRGGSLPATQGKACPIQIDPSLTIDTRGHLICERQGVLILLDGRVRVSDLLNIPGSIGLTTGNVDFQGSVVVGGGMDCDSKVRTDGDLSIRGLIECSQVECGGNFVGQAGLVGHGRGTLHVRGNASIVYAEKISGEIGGDLEVTRELVDCQLLIKGSLRSPHGTILGGHVVVEKSLHVKNLGSAAETATVLELGSVPALGIARRKAHAELDLATKNMEQLLEQERYIRLKPRPTAADRERLTESSYEISQCRTEMKTLENVLAEIEEAAKLSGKVDVHVIGVIHPKVTFQIGSFTAQFMKAVRGPLWIGWDEDRRLVYRLGSQAPRPLTTSAVVRTHSSAPSATRHVA